MEHSNILEIGNAGEREIARLLHDCGISNIRRPDFCVFFRGLWNGVEVKNKEPFEPPPAYMQGIPRRQYLNDMNMTHLGMPCVLVVRGKDNEWLAQYILKLKPQPDPRVIRLNSDELIWFNLSQFEPAKEFFSEITYEAKSLRSAGCGA